MKLPESQRSRLKIPLGILLPDSDTSRQRVLQEIPDDSYVITVGDRTTEKLIEFGVVPSLQITDGLEKRISRPHPELAEKRYAKDLSVTTTLMEVDNPPSEITQEGIDAIRKAFSLPPPVRIHVNGEEDLLVIPACMYAPAGATVMYGQPNQGLVIVGVNSEVRNKTRALLEMMGGM